MYELKINCIESVISFQFRRGKLRVFKMKQVDDEDCSRCSRYCGIRCLDSSAITAFFYIVEVEAHQQTSQWIIPANYRFPWYYCGIQDYNIPKHVYVVLHRILNNFEKQLWKDIFICYLCSI